ncbi:DUF2256 domain-containing protein [Marinobacter sp. chi1]|uniref:DUF2256 domain-containing protein n=1 Tax=Marinobacter suaedae TaxID=3057675 RepID=A0ABT8VXN8_9GAMM|nr:DUF2256 domain-containing protein [Marinobacter sp. chi1]MDO3720757.1 DUF2256 domain-containing protein [Marinobacter sp. chi1]
MASWVFTRVPCQSKISTDGAGRDSENRAIHCLPAGTGRTRNNLSVKINTVAVPCTFDRRVIPAQCHNVIALEATNERRSAVHTKSHLPSKLCPVCHRPFSWRKKWARDWEQVRYCSERCRRDRSRAS